jgi:hypothetical protein
MLQLPAEISVEVVAESEPVVSCVDVAVPAEALTATSRYENE